MTNHTGDAKLAKAINDAGLVVLVDEDVRGTSVHKIFCDNEEGGYLATRHLLEAGHRRIAFVGGPKSMLTTRERLAGYRRAIRESGTDASSIAELFGEYTVEHGRAAAKNLISHVPHATGIFFTSDEVLLGGLEVLEQAWSTDSVGRVSGDLRRRRAPTPFHSPDHGSSPASGRDWQEKRASGDFPG